MSFTAEVKDELSRVKLVDQGLTEAEALSCDRSCLAAMVRICGSLIKTGAQSYRLEMATETGAVARSVIKLIHLVYDLQTELVVRKSFLHKTHNYLIALPDQPGLLEALIDLGLLSRDLRLERCIAPHLIAGTKERAAYLRGAFLGSGFIADPKGDLHFEMVMSGATKQELASEIITLMKQASINAREVVRRNENLVYIKNAEDISSFLALVGAHNGVLAIEQMRVMKSLRNDVNRRVNAEMANQAKSSHASLQQLADIAYLKERGLFEQLPQALKDFCDLRETYPDVNLRELGELAKPKLSKSAVAHRVRRIQQLAQEYREA